MASRGNYHLFAWITILLWALPNVFTRLASAHFTAPCLAFLRFFFASAVLVIVAIVARVRPPRARDLPLFIAGGLIGFGIYMIVFSYGQAMVGSATGSLIIAIVPVCTALIAWPLFRESLRGYQWAAIAIEFGGVAVLAVFESVLTLNSGVFWMLLAVVLFATYNLIQRQITRTYTGLQASIYCMFIGTAFLALWSAPAFEELVTATPDQWVDVLVLAAGPSAIAYMTWSLALERSRNTASVTNYMFITPFLAAIAGFIFAGEVPDIATYFGGAIILVGVALFNFGDRLAAKQRP